MTSFRRLGIAQKTNFELNTKDIFKMMNGSFVHLLPCDTSAEIGTGVSISFVCGNVARETENPKSNVNKIVWKLRNNLVLENVVTLTILLYDRNGAPLKQELIAHKYDSSFTSIKRETFEDPCYPHCHLSNSVEWKSKVEKDLVVSECSEIITFLRKNKDVFSHIKKLRLVCCHYINIPDDLQFMFRAARRLTTIEKVDENNVGAVFDLNEPGHYHGYTPWRFSIGN